MARGRSEIDPDLTERYSRIRFLQHPAAHRGHAAAGRECDLTVDILHPFPAGHGFGKFVEVIVVNGGGHDWYPGLFSFEMSLRLQCRQ